jgi:hypothetical protein
MGLTTRIRKLRTMPPAEIGGRLLRIAYTAYERHAVGSGAAAPPGVGDTVVPAELPPLLPHCASLAAACDSFRTFYPVEVERTLARAHALLRGDVTLFGRLRSCGDTFDWHLDPESGRRWPLVFHADVPLGDRRRAPGDVKNVWELNRQQFLLDLGKAARLTGRRDYVDKVRATIRSWIATNPYGIGVNWAGPLEVAYRALSWLWAYEFLRDAVRADAGWHSEWLASLRDHGRFLYRHLEEFESPFNHLISEASVLFIVGVVVADPDAAKWQRRARRVLEARLPLQFYADGGSVEQSPVYHHATVGFVLMAALVARHHRVEFPAIAWPLLERAIEFAQYMIQPDGRQPVIGDNDDARPLAFDVADNWDFRHFQAIGSVLFGRADMKTTAGRFGEDAFWLLGPAGRAAFDRIQATVPSRVSSWLDGAGYAVLRSDWSLEADYVCFDCGEQAGGLRHDDVPSAAHGHADALGVVVHLGGRPVLVDSGFFSYNGDLAWERYFRETAAHNTVMVDGTSQAIHHDRMTWTRIPRVAVEGMAVDGSHGWARASHDGYVRLTEGITHRRTVWLRPDGYVVLYDELFGRGSHSIEIVFQFSPGLHPTHSAATSAVEDDDVVLAWCATGALEPIVSTAGSGPDGGWVAPHLGLRVPATRLALKGTMIDRATVLTIVADRRVWTAGIAARAHESGLLMRLENDTRCETVLAAVDGRARVDGFETDAPVAAWRHERGMWTPSRITGTFARRTDSTP